MKRTRIFRPGLWLALAALACFLAGDVYAQQLVIWHSYRGAEKSAFEKVVDGFNKKMAAKGVKAKPLAIPYDAYADKISAAVPRGKGPDVFIFAQDRLGGWIEAGNTVESIDFYLEEDAAEHFVEGTMDAMIYRDIAYGLPFNFKPVAMFYNKKLIANPPKTSGELVKVAKSHTDASVGKYGLAYSYADFFFHSALMNGFGGGVFKPGPEPALDQPANIQSTDLMMRWYKQDGILPADPSTALITSLFNDDKAAIVFNGPWFLGELNEDLDFGLAVLPTLDEADGAPMQPWMTVEGLYISMRSENKDAAYDFVQHAVSLESAKTMALEGRQLPALKAIYDLPEVAEDPVLKVFREQAGRAVPMPNYPEMTMVWSPATTAMNKIVKGSASAKEAFGVAQEEVAKAVANLRKK